MTKDNDLPVNNQYIKDIRKNTGITQSAIIEKTTNSILLPIVV